MKYDRNCNCTWELHPWVLLCYWVCPSQSGHDCDCSSHGEEIMKPRKIIWLVDTVQDVGLSLQPVVKVCYTEPIEDGYTKIIGKYRLVEDES